MKKSLWIIVAAALAGPVAGGRAEPAAGNPWPASSTDTIKSVTAGELYGGAKYRDPFRASSAAGGGAGAAGSAPAAKAVQPGEGSAFSIHSLNVKGILKERAGAFAVLVDPRDGASYLLKNGGLFNHKSRRVPGVSGVIQIRQKTVTLMTPDKDVQVLRLGEEADAEGELVQ